MLWLPRHKQQTSTQNLISESFHLGTMKQNHTLGFPVHFFVLSALTKPLHLPLGYRVDFLR